jgi:hypothetical protein
MTQRRLSRLRVGRKDAKKSLGLTLFNILEMLSVGVNILLRLLIAFFNVSDDILFTFYRNV